jgi:DNA-binding transcriptional regulator GbsR (MarR family)
MQKELQNLKKLIYFFNFRIISLTKVKLSIFFESSEIYLYICIMKLSQSQQKFIMSWGSLGSQWGMNKTLAQIHGLFLITNKALCTEDIMDALQISRGNVNMNVRTLIDWGMLYKEHVLGERKEFFIGEKDMWLILKRIMKVRKEKELDPMLHLLSEIKQAAETEHETDTKEFTDRLNAIEKFAKQADKTLDKLLKADEHWFWGPFAKLMK